MEQTAGSQSIFDSRPLGAEKKSARPTREAFLLNLYILAFLLIVLRIQVFLTLKTGRYTYHADGLQQVNA